jgi:2-oxoglutarate ferredoxin oxidoreductase subunit beta
MGLRPFTVVRSLLPREHIWANHSLKAIVVAGDGDTYGEGGNHLIHALRRNADITILVQNNGVYGLTKGQYSPTSPKGFPTKTSPPT